MLLITIYILTFFLVLDCLFLGLLILMQLPKKEAGLGGAAFGGGAVDALIGAGAGNVLTKATKWSAVVFFVLLVSLSQLHARHARSNVSAVSAALANQKAAAKTPPESATPAPIGNPLSSLAIESTNAATSTNTNATLPVPLPSTNPAPKAAAPAAPK